MIRRVNNSCGKTGNGDPQLEIKSLVSTLNRTVNLIVTIFVFFVNGRGLSYNYTILSVQKHEITL